MSRSIAIIGVGKIARDQHIPAIRANDAFVLGGVVSSHARDLGVPVASSVTALKELVPDLAAVSICTPPIGRLAVIEEALHLGLDVMVEKPPAATLSEAECFAGLAKTAGRSLFLTWHSRASAAVEPLKRWLAGRTIERIAIDWQEDVRVWHPGQEWIWEPGIGVFDPGINALSILTRLLDRPCRVEQSTLGYPGNKAAPITADLTLASDAVAAGITARFSFDQRGLQTWTITVVADGEAAVLADGGAKLTIAGQPVALDDVPEYVRLYERFAALVSAGESDADLAPFRLVADSFLLSRRTTHPDFDWAG